MPLVQQAFESWCSPPQYCAYSDTDSFDGIKGKRAYSNMSWQQ